jgi:hypothetical protein
VVAKLSDPHHVEIVRRVREGSVAAAARGFPGSIDRTRRIWRPVHAPDYEGPICAGTQRDLFPSTTVYFVGTFVDPSAKHYDPKQKKYVVGPVTAKVFYQFSGIRDVPAATAKNCCALCAAKHQPTPPDRKDKY